MKVSLDWLKEYVSIDLPVGELSERLTMLGLEVEDVRDLAAPFREMIVGRVLEVKRHPHADRLTICTVDSGSGTLSIVCGAPNVSPEQHVAVALPGAIVPHDQHDPEGKPFAVTVVKIRGENSYGMICSSHELGLGDDKDGIMVLDSNAKPGTPLAQYLGLEDTVLEIGVTPNRPDALCHIGIAREIGILSSRRVKIPSSQIRESRRRAADHATVRIDDVLNCPRYTARVITNVTITDSPSWIKRRLNAVDIRPVNNIVDITNYVLMEIGQPLHAFDYDKIAGHSIIVKTGLAGEPFVTLDGKRRQLRGSELMICDRDAPVALAGIMGGANSEITQATRNILIESAYFNPTSVRRTAKYLGLVTDASQRFERGTDPNITDWAVDRAASLIQRECGGEVLKGRIDEYPKRITPRKASVRLEKVNEILGTNLSEPEVSRILSRLSLGDRSAAKRVRGTRLAVEIPTRRPDLEREIDIVEEVARVYGYHRIPVKSRAEMTYPNTPSPTDLEGILRSWLEGSGFNEIVTNSMTESGIASLTSDRYVELANPISREMATLRTSLVPSMLEIMRYNIAHGTKDLRLFEIGRAYFKDGSTPGAAAIEGFREDPRLVLGLTGLAEPRGWQNQSRLCDINDVKGVVEALFDKIFLDKFKFIPYPNTKALTDLRIAVEINGRDAGYIGRVAPAQLKRFDLEADVYFAELSLEPLREQPSRPRTYHPSSRFPVVMRDIAITVDMGIEIANITEEIRDSGSPLLARVGLFDVYTGSQIDAGKKSCAFALEFMSQDHTLTQQEVDGVMKKIIDRLSSRLQATLRT